MRLINTETLELENFFGEDIPPYATLSHTWGNEEVTFQDMQSLQQHHTKAGFLKIQGTCKLAQQHKLGYAWVDTCCIDKSSSAELTEAINSMFTWYQCSVRCLAYLSDVPTSNSEAIDLRERELPCQKDELPTCLSTISNSRWFTRGWTLQELLAPEEVYFYDSSWNFLGRRSSLPRLLSVVTRIDEDVIKEPKRMHDSAISVATKMSWAAHRTTKKMEDRAYSLLGIFCVHMPLLYGEGDHAFTRLQEEIIRNSDDE
jgi:hypothetical protein